MALHEISGEKSEGQQQQQRQQRPFPPQPLPDQPADQSHPKGRHHQTGEKLGRRPDVFFQVQRSRQPPGNQKGHRKSDDSQRRQRQTEDQHRQVAQREAIDLGALVPQLQVARAGAQQLQPVAKSHQLGPDFLEALGLLGPKEPQSTCKTPPALKVGRLLADPQRIELFGDGDQR